MTVVKTVQTVSYEIDWAALCAGVEALVMAKLKEDLENWKDDLSMRAMFVSDAGASLDVCVALAEGDWPKAEKQLWSMDTAARDYVYDFIEQTAGEEFFTAVNKNR
jgi:hypothetical protein